MERTHDHKHYSTPLKRPEICTKQWAVEQWFLWIQSYLAKCNINVMSPFPRNINPSRTKLWSQKKPYKGECELWARLQHHMATPFLISSLFSPKLRQSSLALASHAGFSTGTAGIHHLTQLLVMCYCFWNPLVILTVSTDSDFQIPSAPLPV